MILYNNRNIVMTKTKLKCTQTLFYLLSKWTQHIIYIFLQQQAVSSPSPLNDHTPKTNILYYSILTADYKNKCTYLKCVDIWGGGVIIIYTRSVMFRLTPTAFMDKKLSESTKLSLLRNEKVKDLQIEDTTILWRLNKDV